MSNIISNISVVPGTEFRQDALTQDMSKVAGLTPDAGRRARMRANAELLNHLDSTQRLGRRTDSVQDGTGIAFARDLEYIYDDVVEEDYKPLNAQRLIPTDTQVGAGYQKHVVESVSRTAEAKDYRGFGDNPFGGTANVQKDRKTFEVGTYVTGIRISFTDRLAEGFTNTNLRSEMRTAAQEALMELTNERTWYGNEAYNILGVLNYPYVPKTASTVDMSPSGTPADQLAELHRLANLLGNNSDNTYMPDKLIAPISLVNYWSNTKVSLDGDTDTILALFLKHNQYIESVEGIREMDSAGPGGEDVLYFYAENDRRACCNVVPQAPTMLPIQEVGVYDLMIPMYMRHGGVIMRKPANNLVAYV